jgi:hypothetical protein
VTAPLRVHRRDLSEIPQGGLARLRSGALRIAATPSRVGVFQYRDPATGELYGELKPPESVFDPASMRSLAGVPVTVGHPSDDVVPGNWRELSRGHVGDDVRAAGARLDASVVVHESDAVSRVEARDLVELSCGYTCSVTFHEERVWTDGTRYRATQGPPEYNHVALLQRGQARGGPEVRLHVDRRDAGEEDPTVKTLFALSKDRRSIRIDGKDYDLTNEAQRLAAVGALRGAISAQAQRADAIADEAALRAAYERLRGLLDGLPEVVGQMGAAIGEAAAAEVPPEEVMALAMETADAIAHARELAPDLRVDGIKSVHELRVAVIKHVDGRDVSKEDPKYVEGLYEGVVSSRGTFDADDLEDLDAAPEDEDRAPAGRRGDDRGARSALDRHRAAGRAPLRGARR